MAAPAARARIWIPRSCCRRRSPIVAAMGAQVDPQALLAQALVLGITGAAGAYWWSAVVPSERAKLGRSKRSGAMKDYLEQIVSEEEPGSRSLERWFYSEWIDKGLRKGYIKKAAKQQQQEEEEETVEEAVDDYQDEPPSFLSLDNPIVATLAILLGILALALARSAAPGE